MSVLQQYKCPCCGGFIEFDSSVQKMKCPFCDSEFEMETLAAYDKDLKNEKEDDMNWDKTPSSEWGEGEADGLSVYVCNSCGGEIVCDDTTAASFCPYCNNPVVMRGKLSGALRPDLVIPFKKDKDSAIAALKKHYKGKRLLPKVFKDENHIKEIKGVYVPFWLFDTEVNANIRYKATRVRAWSDARYNYTETSFFAVNRGGSVAFDNVPVDGSSKMDDALMESIEPFDLEEAVDFQTAYLSGYLADKYDIDAKKSIVRANERIKKSTEDAFRDTVRGYASVTPESTQVSFANGKAKYALFPVWILNTKWKDKTYTFAMNGQTGKIVGDLPADKSLSRKMWLSIFAVSTAVAFGAQFLLWLM